MERFLRRKENEKIKLIQKCIDKKQAIAECMRYYFSEKPCIWNLSEDILNEFESVIALSYQYSTTFINKNGKYCNSDEVDEGVEVEEEEEEEENNERLCRVASDDDDNVEKEEEEDNNDDDDNSDSGRSNNSEDGIKNDDKHYTYENVENEKKTTTTTTNTKKNFTGKTEKEEFNDSENINTSMVNGEKVYNCCSANNCANFKICEKTSIYGFWLKKENEASKLGKTSSNLSTKITTTTTTTTTTTLNENIYLVNRKDNDVLKMYLSYMLGTCMNKIKMLLNIHRLTKLKSSRYISEDSIVQITNDTAFQNNIDVSNINYVLPMAYCMKCYGKKESRMLKIEKDYDFILKDIMCHCEKSRSESVILCKITNNLKKRNVNNVCFKDEIINNVDLNSDTSNIRCKVQFKSKSILKTEQNHEIDKPRDYIYNLQSKLFYIDVMNLLMVMRFQINEILTQIDEMVHQTLLTFEPFKKQHEPDKSKKEEMMKKIMTEIHDVLIHTHFVKKAILSILSDMFLELRVLYEYMLNINPLKIINDVENNITDDVFRISLSSKLLIDKFVAFNHFKSVSEVKMTDPSKMMSLLRSKFKHIPIIVFCSSSYMHNLKDKKIETAADVDDDDDDDECELLPENVEQKYVKLIRDIIEEHHKHSKE